MKKYLFYPNGDIRNVKKNKLIHVNNLNIRKNNSILLYDDNNNHIGVTIHRAVAELFLDNPNKYTDIRHKDKNLHNNKVSNLEFFSRSTELVDYYKERFSIIDSDKRWDCSQIPPSNQHNSQTYVPFICNGCGCCTKRTWECMVTNYKPCKKNCYIIKSKKYTFADIETIEINDIETPEIQEEWKVFPDNTNYEISNMGKIKNIRTGRILTGCVDNVSGYERTSLNNKNTTIHYAVAKTFIPNLEIKPCIDHINSVRTDNRVSNLRWCTYSENNNYKNDNSTKEYKPHKNGRQVRSINPRTKEEKIHPTLMCASKWILENIKNIDTTNKDIDKQLRSNSSYLSSRIIKNNNSWFGYNLIWQFVDNSYELTNEEWREITTIEKDGYYISNFGRLKTPNGKIKDTCSITGGYYDLKIIKGGKHHKIHRLVAMHFIPNPENKPFVNHINLNKFDNRVDNLEWCTNGENIQHAYKNGANSRASKVIQYDKNGKKMIKEFPTIECASEELNIPSSQISAVCRGISLQTCGFHFKYAENKDNQIRSRKYNRTNSKKVFQYDNEKQLICTHKSVSQCALYFKVKQGMIKTRLKGGKSTNLELNRFIFTYSGL